VNTKAKRSIARLDLVLALLIGAIAILVICSANVTDGAPPVHMRNVDAGAIAQVAAMLYLAPAAALLGLAGLGMLRNWRAGWPLQAVALAWVAVLVVGTTFGWLL